MILNLLLVSKFATQLGNRRDADPNALGVVGSGGETRGYPIS